MICGPNGLTSLRLLRFPFLDPSPFMRHSHLFERSHEGVGEKERWQSASRCACRGPVTNRYLHSKSCATHPAKLKRIKELYSSLGGNDLEVHAHSFLFFFSSLAGSPLIIFTGQREKRNQKLCVPAAFRRAVFFDSCLTSHKSLFFLILCGEVRLG